MNKVDKNYVELLLKIKEQGFDCEPARTNMPGTRALFGEKLEFDNKIYPILQGKKVSFKNIITELLWFLRGDTNIKFLNENGCKIWNDDAYRFYLEKGGSLTKDEFIENSINQPGYPWNNKSELNPEKLKFENYNTYGDCGRIYGFQWRNLGINNYERIENDGIVTIQKREKVDQIDRLIKGLIQNPFSRYHIVDSWNIQDFSEKYQCLPACHTNFMCNVFKKEGEFYLDLAYRQRSCDTPLGVPYNIASYALLQRILCEITGYKLGKLICYLDNVHYYENQQEYVNTYIQRALNNEIPDEDVQVIIDSFNWNGNIDNIKIEDFKLVNYKPLDAIKTTLSVGL